MCVNNLAWVALDSGGWDSQVQHPNHSTTEPHILSLLATVKYNNTEICAISQSLGNISSGGTAVLVQPAMHETP